LTALVRYDAPGRSARARSFSIVVITFPDPDTQKKALGFLQGRFSGKVLKTGEHLVPETALEALAERNFEFTVKGMASYGQQNRRTTK